MINVYFFISVLLTCFREVVEAEEEERRVQGKFVSIFLGNLIVFEYQNLNFDGTTVECLTLI